MQFIDLKKQYERIETQMNDRIHQVLNHQKFIMGPEIEEFEKKLAEYTGRKHALTCASGTDALVIPLMAYGLKVTDAIFVPSFTFFASAESVNTAGGTPVFVETADDFNVDVQLLREAIQKTKNEGKLNPRGIIAVDLFGQTADYEGIQKVADEFGLFVIEDGAQSMGGSFKGKKNGAFGDVSATSFFPAKPLGCYGDGGAIFTDDDELAEIMKSIRVHGQGTSRYDNVRIGVNGRMDTIQAAVLLAKIDILDDEIKARQVVAHKYMELLDGVFELPIIHPEAVSAWAQFTMLAKDEEQRDMIVEKMKEHDIPIMIYYPLPMHMQTAYSYLGYQEQDIPKASAFGKRVFSVPMHPYMTEEDVKHVADALKSIVM